MHHPVTDTALAGRCSKPVCMACNPIGQEASIGAAGDTDPGPVNLGIYVQNVVRKLHQVIIVQGSVDAGDRRIGIPMAVASSGITEEYKVTLIGPKLHLMVENHTIAGLGAAMDVQNSWVSTVYIIIGRGNHPAGYGYIVMIFKIAGNGRANLVTVCIVPIKICQSGFLTRDQIKCIQLLQAHVPHSYENSLITLYVKAVYGPFPAADLAEAAVGCHLKQVTGFKMCGGEVYAVSGTQTGGAGSIAAVGADAQPAYIMVRIAKFRNFFAGKVKCIEGGIFIAVMVTFCTPSWRHSKCGRYWAPQQCCQFRRECHTDRRFP